MFVVIALNTDDGRSTEAALLYFGIAWGDQLDGLAARLTGQYSRLGALLDPLTDRALVLAGAIVCWNFELLPRWALAVLAARELFMLILTQVGAAPRDGPRGEHGGPVGGVADHVRHLPDAGGVDARSPRRRCTWAWC